ncbi:hypothetical protein PHYBOEH_006816 [Phytophthora boehmeriae]|uniref:Telomerase reverse transcriptase n=1 Tax=Phytophthora boehmeriae TaxID=109152 RepID=A0A8T1WC58_9STRA|nr:hypothetical protein PHYBOEH_006816 [Phytophthora boehmeriae]
MDALIARAQTLRCYLQSANGDSGLEQKLAVETNPDVCYALDQTFLVQAKKEAVEALPRAPWSCENCISHTELIHHVIERLLARKRTAVHWEDANILTLGYREVTPGASGHRVTQSNGIMCYYPNTLVSTLKKPLWESLHQLMGDDLMTHLLLNYTIFARVKDMQLSYIQLAGKSLRKDLALITGNTALAHQTPAPGAVSKREISINQVMYARHFQKDRVFASSHTLVKASKTSAAGELISRGEAARVLRSIFTDIAGEKRLPKRLINLIPSVQALVARFKACDVEDLSRKLAPLSPSFRKFMANNPDIKRTIAERKADAEAASQPLILPIVCKALDDGYLSQTEESNSDRKRKRREEAIVVLSHASEVSSTTLLAPPSKKQKNILNNGIKDRNRVCEKPNLANLQEHKEDIKNVLTFTTPKKKVYRLVRKLVARVVPKTVWGDGETKKNWKCVKAMLRKLIFSRKFDIFTLKKCAYEFQVTNVEWMSHQAKATFCPPNEKIKRHRLFEDLLGWVVSTLVFPLLRNLFYITEAEGMANEIAYYQRPVWNVISALALDDLEGGILQPSNEQAVAASHERQLATSRLRLLPKATGVRPLMNLATPVDQASVSVNSQANFASAGAEAEEKEGGVRRGDTQEPEGCLSWCGMLIDPTNLQIYVNYDKLSGSLVQASIPLNEMKSARSFFVNKVISPIRQRWHALYFDPDFLSEDTIHINLFQMLVVTAHRFTLLIEMLPFVNQDMRFFYECILQILRKATKGIHRSLELARGASTMTCEPNAASNRQSRDQSSVSYQVQKRQVSFASR